jgi:hypothetical protein
MNRSRLLWMLVTANVFLTFATVGAQGMLAWTLPPELAEYTRSRFSGTWIWNVGHMFHLMMLATTALFAFASWIALLSSWRLARGLYVFSWALGMLLVLSAGPSVRTSLSAMFQEMNGLVGGAIIGLVYFSGLAERFERGAVGQTAPATMDTGTSRA